MPEQAIYGIGLAIVFLGISAIWLLIRGLQETYYEKSFCRIDGLIEGSERCPGCGKCFGEYLPRHRTQHRGHAIGNYVPKRVKHNLRGKIVCPACYSQVRELVQSLTIE